MMFHSQIVKSDVTDYAFSMSLNINIRRIRESRGLNVSELAEMVGISVPHMSGVERGKKNLNNHLLERIAKALKVTPAALIAEDIGDAGRLLSVLPALSEADRERVAQFAEALRKSEPGGSRAE